MTRRKEATKSKVTTFIVLLVLIFSMFNIFAFPILSSSTINLFSHVKKGNTTFRIPQGKPIESGRLIVKAYNSSNLYLGAIRFKIDDIGGIIGCERVSQGQYRGEGTIGPGATKSWTYDLSNIQVAYDDYNGSYYMNYIDILNSGATHSAFVKITQGDNSWVDVDLILEFEDDLQPSSVEIWIDKGCGGYYNHGDRIKVSFKVSSPASTATVTLVDYTPDGRMKYIIMNEIISTNRTYELGGTVECPEGVETLEIIATVVVGGQVIELRDECYFHVGNCPVSHPDRDNDGYTSDEDCDDYDSTVYPGAPEVCDGKDNDCDDRVDEGYDNDGDGYSTCEGDKNDNDPTIHPGASEICDGKDNDGDGNVDEGCPEENCDKDNDGFNSRDCGGNDCNDNDPDKHPGASEICDGKDNNCNGQIDEGCPKERCNREKDSDEDGVNDCDDECPNTPWTRMVDEKGCPTCLSKKGACGAEFYSLQLYGMGFLGSYALIENDLCRVQEAIKSGDYQLALRCIVSLIVNTGLLIIDIVLLAKTIMSGGSTIPLDVAWAGAKAAKYLYLCEHDLLVEIAEKVGQNAGAIYDSINEDIAQTLAERGTDSITVFAGSPVELRIKDEKGNILSRENDTGIPLSFFFEHNGHSFAYILDPEGDYSIEILGTGSGTYDLKTKVITNGRITASEEYINVGTLQGETDVYGVYVSPEGQAKISDSKTTFRISGFVFYLCLIGLVTIVIALTYFRGGKKETLSHLTEGDISSFESIRDYSRYERRKKLFEDSKKQPIQKKKDARKSQTPKEDLSTEYPKEFSRHERRKMFFESLAKELSKTKKDTEYNHK